jgi:diaminopimelate decarboxylase
MKNFYYDKGTMFVEKIAMKSIAESYGTPSYIYSRAALTNNFLSYLEALDNQPHKICYSVKANSNIAVLGILAKLGAGFDIVSGGELERVILAGGDPKKIIFSGVGKTPEEMRRAIELGVHCFNVESEAELKVLNDVAQSCKKIAPVSLRVNPDVDANTHPYISTGLRENKFGIDIKKALGVYLKTKKMKSLKIIGVDCHIGSQLIETAPFIDALKRVLVLVDNLQEHGIHIEHLDIGGGLGVCYKDEKPPQIRDYVKEIVSNLEGRNITLILEPGRSIVADAGVLLTKIEYLKPGEEKNFAVIDAAMNDMIRPALYQAWLAVELVTGNKDLPKKWDIVGPICETGDFIAKDRLLAIRQGDLLCVRSAGAYGFSMSSNYNSRCKAAEIMVDGNNMYEIRKRETVQYLVRGESLLPNE